LLRCNPVYEEMIRTYAPLTDKESVAMKWWAGITDVVEAMSSFRRYRPTRSRAEVLKEIGGGRGTKYDADVVDVVAGLIESGELEMGEAAK